MSRLWPTQRLDLCWHQLNTMASWYGGGGELSCLAMSTGQDPWVLLCPDIISIIELCALNFPKTFLYQQLFFQVSTLEFVSNMYKCWITTPLVVWLSHLQLRWHGSYATLLSSWMNTLMSLNKDSKMSICFFKLECLSVCLYMSECQPTNCSCVKSTINSICTLSILLSSLFTRQFILIPATW